MTKRSKFLRLKDATKLLFNLSWMSCIIYALLLKFAEEDLTGPKYAHHEEQFGDAMMEELGFISQPKLYPQGYHDIDEKEWPVFAMTLQSEEVEHLVTFLLNYRTYFLNHRLVIYSLDLSKEQKDYARERCFCQVRDVMWKRYPNHIRNWKTHGYLAILIQETLQEFGTVFWGNVEMKFNSSRLKPELSTQAQYYGLTAWTRDRYPTSTFTYHNLYKLLDTYQSDYFFHPMVFPTPALYYNTDTLHRFIMKPWIKCILNPNCISPTGAQATGCNFNIKPKYRYCGCHRYSTSVLNIILGRLHHFQAPYIGDVKVYANTFTQSEAPVLKYITNWHS